MKKNTHKPSPQAKALSLFLMAHKEKNPFYKEELKRINKQWDLLRNRKINSEEYKKEVETMLAKYGGYDEVVEKTVRFYIDKTGEWKLNGDDPYCKDAQQVADKLLKK